MDDATFLEYLEIQNSLDLVSKTELLQQVRDRGRRISDRQLTTLISEGLVPKSARIGSKRGAYPAITVDLLLWVLDLRDKGVSVHGVKELEPVFRWMQRAVRSGVVDLAEFELVAQASIVSKEAAFSLPWLLQSCLPCPTCESDGLGELKFVLKDGQTVGGTDSDDHVGIGFGIRDSAAPGPEADRCVASMRISIPRRPPEADPSTVIVGLPLSAEEEELSESPA